MILSGKEIKKHLYDTILIEPYDEKQLNPNSYNLRLHQELLVYSNRQLDMKLPKTYLEQLKKMNIEELNILAEGYCKACEKKNA